MLLKDNEEGSWHSPRGLEKGSSPIFGNANKKMPNLSINKGAKTSVSVHPQHDYTLTHTEPGDEYEKLKIQSPTTSFRERDNTSKEIKLTETSSDLFNFDSSQSNFKGIEQYNLAAISTAVDDLITVENNEALKAPMDESEQNKLQLEETLKSLKSALKVKASGSSAHLRKVLYAFQQSRETRNNLMRDQQEIFSTDYFGPDLQEVSGQLMKIYGETQRKTARRVLNYVEKKTQDRLLNSVGTDVRHLFSKKYLNN